MENLTRNNTQANPELTEKLSKKYASTKHKLFFFEIIFTFIGLIILIVGGIGGISGQLSSSLLAYIPNIWLVIGAYVGIISILSAVFFLPSDFFGGYLLEHKYNLSTQTKKSWLKDKLKSFTISLALSLIIVEVLYLLLRQTGTLWWLWAGFLWIFFTLILTHIAPILLIPLFFKLTPLQDNDLVDKLKDLSKKAGSNVLGIFEIDFSKKTKKANAAFTGIGKTKRILLSDTLLHEFSHEEIEVILAHELAHYKFKHLWQLLLLAVVSTFIGLYAADYVLINSVYKLGFSGIADIGAFPLFSLVLFIFMVFSLPINNTFSRKLERQADKEAIKLTNNPKAFISSMEKLARQNLSDKTPNPVIYFLLHNHPSISERINMAKQHLIN